MSSVPQDSTANRWTSVDQLIYRAGFDPDRIKPVHIGDLWLLVLSEAMGRDDFKVHDLEHMMNAYGFSYRIVSLRP